MAEPVVEQVAETLVETLGPVEEYIRVGHQWIAVGFVGGLGLGLVGGYFFAKKRLETKYDKIAQEEIDEARDYYRAAKAATEARLKAPITEVVEYLGYVKTEDTIGTAESDAFKKREAAENLIDYHKKAVGEGEPAEEAVQGVFEAHPPSDHEWNMPAELMARKQNPDVPFVIHLDEFGELHDEDYTTVCYTWYYEDEILADERDEPIDNIDETVGLDNLQRFGHGSGNAHVVLVRNTETKTDIEISRSDGKYVDNVTPYLQHQYYQVEKMRKRHERFDDADIAE
jgi:hypothetical protein